MMRIVVNFRVSGSSLDELREKALDQYRALTGDASAEIPYSATVTVSPAETVTDIGGKVTVISWEGDVDISVAAGDSGGAGGGHL